MAGVEEVTLTTPQMPAHKHTLAVSGQPGTSANPVGQHLAESTLSNFKSYGPGSGAVMPSSTISLSGGSTPHNNLQPYLSLNYVIALEGIYPSRN